MGGKKDSATQNDRRRMLKSPSAKELGRHKMAPIVPPGLAGKKEESKRPSGLPLGASKINNSTRTSIKVPTNRTLANATARITTNVGTPSAAVKRTKYVPGQQQHTAPNQKY